MQNTELHLDEPKENDGQLELLAAAEAALNLLVRLRDREKVADAPEIRRLGAAIVYIKEGK